MLPEAGRRFRAVGNCISQIYAGVSIYIDYLGLGDSLMRVVPGRHAEKVTRDSTPESSVWRGPSREFDYLRGVHRFAGPYLRIRFGRRSDTRLAGQRHEASEAEGRKRRHRTCPVSQTVSCCTGPLSEGEVSAR